MKKMLIGCLFILMACNGYNQVMIGVKSGINIATTKGLNRSKCFHKELRNNILKLTVGKYKESRQALIQ